MRSIGEQHEVGGQRGVDRGPVAPVVRDEGVPPRRREVLQRLTWLLSWLSVLPVFKHARSLPGGARSSSRGQCRRSLCHHRSMRTIDLGGGYRAILMAEPVVLNNIVFTMDSAGVVSAFALTTAICGPVCPASPHRMTR